MKGPFKILKDAVRMVGRTLKTYVLLSVTIVLSFSLLLGYLLYADSAFYTKYAYTMSLDSRVLYAYGRSGLDLMGFKDHLEKVQGTEVYYLRTLGTSLNRVQYALDDGTKVRLPYVTLAVVPAHVPALVFQAGRAAEVKWLDGRQAEDVHLAAGEMLLDADIFEALKLGEKEEPTLFLDMSTYSSKTRTSTSYRRMVKVVGTVKITGQRDYSYIKYMGSDRVQLTRELLEINGSYTNGYAVMSQEDPELVDFARNSSVQIMVLSDNPKRAQEAAKTFSVTLWANLDTQNDAMDRMQLEERTKAVIAIAIMILMSINLYSSFTNALSERRFEIGVKRAIGASSWAIVRQFLYEGLMVMAVNILLSIGLVADVAIIYKFIYQQIPVDKYGTLPFFYLHLSNYSIMMFTGCALSLSVAFSLIFAYRSTQVEIVEYLKAE